MGDMERHRTGLWRVATLRRGALLAPAGLDAVMCELPAAGYDGGCDHQG
jgi:hypothetical protein